MSQKTTPVQRGGWAQEIAEHYLRLVGYEILDRNRRGDGGEIDVVARHLDCLVFVEVRYRGRAGFSTAVGSLDARKRHRLRRCARYLLRTRTDLRWSRRSIRFDLVALDLTADGLELTHLKALAV